MSAWSRVAANTIPTSNRMRPSLNNEGVRICSQDLISGFWGKFDRLVSKYHITVPQRRAERVCNVLITCRAKSAHHSSPLALVWRGVFLVCIGMDQILRFGRTSPTSRRRKPTRKTSPVNAPPTNVGQNQHRKNKRSKDTLNYPQVLPRADPDACFSVVVPLVCRWKIKIA